MSEYEELLSIYTDLIERSSQLMGEEMEQISGQPEAESSLLIEKKKLIQEMDGALYRLKSLNSVSSGVPIELKEAFDALQHNFMRAIKMDRELEKVYLEKQRVAKRVDFGNSVDRAGAKRLYGI